MRRYGGWFPKWMQLFLCQGADYFHLCSLLRREPSFDVAILFPNSLRAALESWLTAIPRRVGYRGHWRRWLLNQIVPIPRKPGPPEHHSLRFLRIARECGADTEQPLTEKISNAQRQTPYAQLTGVFKPSVAENHQLKIGLCAGAEYGPAKRWLPERFAEAAERISAQSPVQWMLFGTARDASAGAQVAAALGDHCVNRIGQTTLDQLIDELREMPFTAYKRYRHNASRRIVGNTCRCHFRLNGAATHWPTWQRSHHSATSCRMQSLFSSRMSD